MTSPAPRETPRPLRILLVEDNYGDQLLTQREFTKSSLPHRIRVAKDGEEAMEILCPQGSHAANELPDLILLDINLPKRNGKEVLAAIRANSWLRRLPVIMLTSSRAEQDVVETLELDISGYLVKPFTMPSFLTAIGPLGGIQSILNGH